MFCLVIKKNSLPLHPLKNKSESMNITTLHNQSVWNMICVVVVTPRGEEGCMC